MDTRIGLDLGNSDTKTQDAIIPSSYRVYSKQNLLAGEYVFYKNNYYIPTKERNNQQYDKTVNNYCIIMALFGIAKQLIETVKRENPGIREGREIQEKLNNIHTFPLGIGLPAGYYSSLAKATIECYENEFVDPFTFTYCDYEFHLRMTSCKAFPQDFTAVISSDDISITKKYKSYNIVGIGGGTADVIPVNDGEPDIEKIITFEKGSTVMYSEISKILQQETAKITESTVIEDVLLGNPTVIDDFRKNRIFEIAKEFADKLIDEIIHNGIRLSDYPCVFIGGGALIIKKYLETNSKLTEFEFVTDINANAKSYALFLED